MHWIKEIGQPADNTQRFRFTRSGKERQLEDSYTLLYWDNGQIRELMEVRTYWGSGHNTMYACCWIRDRHPLFSTRPKPHGQMAGGCKVDWNYTTRSVHGAICAAGLKLHETLAGHDPRAILYGIAKDLGLAAPYVVHAHK